MTSVDVDLLNATNKLLAHVGLVDLSSKSTNKVLSISELQTVSIVCCLLSSLHVCPNLLRLFCTIM